MDLFIYKRVLCCFKGRKPYGFQHIVVHLIISVYMHLISLYWFKRIIDVPVWKYVTAETFLFKNVLQILWSTKTDMNAIKKFFLSLAGDLSWMLYLLKLWMSVIYLTFTPVLRTFSFSVVWEPKNFVQNLTGLIVWVSKA